MQAHRTYCALCLYHYHVSSASNHQVLDPGGWGPLPWGTALYGQLIRDPGGTDHGGQGFQSPQRLGSQRHSWLCAH